MKKFLTKRNLINLIGLFAGFYLTLNSFDVNSFAELKELFFKLLNNWDMAIAFLVMFLGYITNDDLKLKIFNILNKKMD